MRVALEQAEQMCVHINDAVRSKENTEQLEWLQTHIQFTLDEVCGCVCVCVCVCPTITAKTSWESKAWLGMWDRD